MFKACRRCRIILQLELTVCHQDNMTYLVMASSFSSSPPKKPEMVSNCLQFHSVASISLCFSSVLLPIVIPNALPLSFLRSLSLVTWLFSFTELKQWTLLIHYFPPKNRIFLKKYIPFSLRNMMINEKFIETNPLKISCSSFHSTKAELSSFSIFNIWALQNADVLLYS